MTSAALQSRLQSPKFIGFEQDIKVDNFDACVAFGERLIETGDLDPVYIAVVGAALPEPQVARLLLAYWCYYHLGAAAWLSEREDDYWQHMRIAAVNETPPSWFGPKFERWPRAAERRHFRGQKCVAAIDWLKSAQPEDRVRALAKMERAEDIMAAVQTWPMFGKWVSFKILDMLYRVYGTSIKIPDNITLMYSAPRKTLELLPENAYPKMLQHFSKFKAPPVYDSPCGPLEIETILCKAGSNWNGHYTIGKDTNEVKEGLHGWGKTAEKLMKCLPDEKLR